MGRFQSNPGMQHWIVGKKILRYLHRRKAYMLIYRHTENSELVGYADVNIRKAEDDYISTSGFLFKIAGVVVAWKSAKQSGVLSSTMFSEYIACYEATSHAVWLWNFIEDIKVVDSISRPV
ncbi:secreted RxLR effector protein 161-like [Prunus dulcis]|uniref:secreted RxLR effector protein 161-like n=1 Tax=Prunus dulcis TaxID=3755 RepID=UPI0014825828|nr:secreted RxLR effector protein 161-like [Prunus dulcis]